MTTGAMVVVLLLLLLLLLVEMQLRSVAMMEQMMGCVLRHSSA